MSGKVKIRSFTYKWYQFLIVYAIFNILVSCFAYETITMPGLMDELEYEDADAFSKALMGILVPAMVMMDAMVLVLNIAVLVVLELVAMFIFRLLYFRSQVSAEEKD